MFLVNGEEYSNYLLWAIFHFAVLIIFIINNYICRAPYAKLQRQCVVLVFISIINFVSVFVCMDMFDMLTSR